jgi:hypothetical protein
MEEDSVLFLYLSQIARSPEERWHAERIDKICEMIRKHMAPYNQDHPQNLKPVYPNLSV